MAHVALTFEQVDSAEDVNRITTALMEMDGVEEAEVGRHGAEVDGRVRREALLQTVRALGYKAH
ncbi:hypothetical protein HLV40_06505 [Chromohalobacter salexigens]|uniref:HMA domain-containing protein n=1 Tax=Chromohalobacter moromii TaxID=2860329 RepID=A0A9X3AYH0_9GAMM|nr:MULTISPECIES: hypothetical protein [Chromohalobacter]NWO10045.1 hypothetical protein [Chromohalobacter salexigens]CDQ36107.1 hypothetical protein BN993_05604 [Virgibacillus halodenitrificans]MCK2044134.1 hypothetical protein [Chromohalobacter moromii]MCK2046939.1 hypothetical protein [Chromohalobacter moromii]MCT8506516.1 hypothetical protein [Chromohalobacter moromii]